VTCSAEDLCIFGWVGVPDESVILEVISADRILQLVYFKNFMVVLLNKKMT